MRGTTASLVALLASGPGVEPGLWRVVSLVQGTTSATTHLVCHRGDASLRLLVPTLGSGVCAMPGSSRVGSLNATGSCLGGSTLTITGTVRPTYFDVVAHRSGPVGMNSRARASVTTHGTLVSRECGGE